MVKKSKKKVTKKEEFVEEEKKVITVKMEIDAESEPTESKDFKFTYPPIKPGYVGMVKMAPDKAKALAEMLEKSVEEYEAKTAFRPTTNQKRYLQDLRYKLEAALIAAKRK